MDSSILLMFVYKMRNISEKNGRNSNFGAAAVFADLAAFGEMSICL